MSSMKTEHRPSGAQRRRFTAHAEGASTVEPAPDVRHRILETASRLFYERGVRAVGVDLVVQEAAVAKTSLYRYFPTKDDLIVAFLQREDVEFWEQWSRVAAQFPEDPLGELDAHMRWIGERLSRSNYRGCPQINVAAEFAELDHPSRQVSRRHMQTLRERLLQVVQQLDVSAPNQLAAQLAVFVNGAFVSSGLLTATEATEVLQSAVKALVAGARRKK